MESTDKPTYGRRFVVASEHLILDSNVDKGGGTDETTQIQTILDMAPVWGGLHLYMDGAALVSACLRVHSNTTIECPSADCGFFLKDGSDCSLVCNADIDENSIRNCNISLIGGTYNFNCPGQARYKGYTPDNPFVPDDVSFSKHKMAHGMRFFGVENLLIRDVRMVNQRIYAALFANWKRVTIENVDISLPDNQYAQNQDGLHFFGPGQWLTIRNISGTAGDDFIALAPDEGDYEANQSVQPNRQEETAITDVVIDGVYLRDSDQGIRMLSRRKGRLDRVFVRNVYGTYKSCGFFINPWFGEDTGNYGNIVFENVHLQPTWHKYADYSRPFLFRIGGYIENLTLKNITCINAADNRPLVDVSHTYGHWVHNTNHFAHVVNLTVDGLQVVNTGGTMEKTDYIQVEGARVDNLILRNVVVKRGEGHENGDVLVHLKEGADVGILTVNEAVVSGIGALLVQDKGAKLGVTAGNTVLMDGVPQDPYGLAGR